MRKSITCRMSLFAVLAAAAFGVFPLCAADVTIGKPYIRWLFGGFGFQNPEANFLALMSDEFRDQRVLKTFAETSPSFTRVYAGYADQSREQMDRFADFYDLTFRKAGTTLYVVPGPMSAFADTVDVDEYAEKVAKNLDYLINVRKCRKIRYYCLTNELMCGDDWSWFARPERRGLFKKYNIALYHAFRRHGLDIKLLASDEAATTRPECVFPFLDWVGDNMDAYVGAYCTHWYVYRRRTDDLKLWNDCNAYFKTLVQKALSRKAKRYILGEFGFCPVFGKPGVMVDDAGYSVRQPGTSAEGVLSKCEVGLSAMNQGAFACVSWSFVDYPDPFVIENGDTPEERARYEAGLCGYRMDTKYNKWGMFRWSTTDKNYAAYPELYAMGWLVKLFRKNATVLTCTFADPMLRGGAVMNPDQSVSIAVINRGSAKTATIDCSSWKTRVDGTPAFHQPLRRYVYEVAAVPYSPFNDLQPMSGTVEAKDGIVTVQLPAKSMTFLTTDYKNRVPAPIAGVRIADGRLAWTANGEPEHRYYRVYKDGKQIASTVATSFPVPGAVPGDVKRFSVKSVDKWNNVR